MQIRRLQVKVDGRAEQPALQLWLGRLLSSADLRPRGIAPSEVLVIDRLIDPLPGRIAQWGAHRIDPMWEGAVRELVAQHWRRAARPVRGRVDHGAPAVRFREPAERAAASLVARSEGTLPWWALRSGLASLEAPDLAAVLAYLTEWGTADLVLGAVPGTEAQRLLERLAGWYGLPQWERLVQPEAGAYGHLPQAAGALSRVLTKLLRSVPGSLGRAQRALLACALLLGARPGLARTQGLVPALDLWLSPSAPSDELKTCDVENGIQNSDREFVFNGKRRSSEQMQSISEPVQSFSEHAQRVQSISERLQSFSERAQRMQSISERLQSFSEHAQRVQSASEHVQSYSPAREAGSSLVGRKTSSEHGDSHVYTDAQHGELDVEPGEALIRSSSGDPIHRDEMRASKPDGAAAGHEELHGEGSPGVHTQLGGLLYLVNLLIRLDLPDSWEEGWALASEVGAWALLEGIGRELLGHAELRYQSDPVWSALAQLDGREPGTAPGAGYSRTPPFALPPEWLLLIDGAVPMTPEDGPERMAEPFRRLTALLTPFIRLCLTSLLCTDDLESAILRAPAQVYVSRTHLDVVFSLDAISLPVRMAGLDRNPGWAPAFGRVVQFHYL